jgi:hypothetical protein
MVFLSPGRTDGAGAARGAGTGFGAAGPLGTAEGAGAGAEPAPGGLADGLAGDGAAALDGAVAGVATAGAGCGLPGGGGGGVRCGPAERVVAAGDGVVAVATGWGDADDAPRPPTESFPLPRKLGTTKAPPSNTKSTTNNTNFNTAEAAVAITVEAVVACGAVRAPPLSTIEPIW